MNEPGRIESKIQSLDDDLLDFKRELNGFKKVLLTVKPKFVLSIEAPWGSGKSSFLNILENELKVEYDVIRINAWESDFSKDPIAAILNSLSKSELYKKNATLINDIYRLGLKFAKNLLPIIVSIVTQGILSKKDIENFGLSDLTEEVTSTMVSEFKEQEDDLVKIRENLEKLVENSKSKRIFFLVDELDRCRPIYAVEFLESIKHLFNTEGIVFVLAIEDKVLKDQMRQIYGVEFESDEYLKKFIDIRYKLVPRVTLKLIRYRFEEYNIHKLLEDKKYFVPLANDKVLVNHFENLIFALGHLYKFSPRDINQIITKFLLLLSKDSWDNKSPLITLFLLILQHHTVSALEYFINASNLSYVYKESEIVSNFIGLKRLLHMNELKNLDSDFYPFIQQVVARIINVKAGSIKDFQQHHLKAIFDYRPNSGIQLTEIMNVEKALYESTFYTFDRVDKKLLKKSYEQVLLMD